MNHLNRELAPITTKAWELIDEEAGEALTQLLAGRRLVEFTGPIGWDRAALATGEVDLVDGVGEGAQVLLRSVLRMIEIRVPFRLERGKLDQIDRGAPAVDLDSMIEAARRVAAIEDGVIFDGLEEAAVTGCAQHSEHDALTLADEAQLPSAVAEGMAVLQDAGVEGPYGLALGPETWRAAVTTIDGGYPMLKHLRLLTDGPVVRARTLSGGVLMSQRGGDFELVAGEDLAIGYAGCDEDAVQLYLTESFTFRNHEPAAAISLQAAT